MDVDRMISQDVALARGRARNSHSASLTRRVSFSYFSQLFSFNNIALATCLLITCHSSDLNICPT